MVHPAHPKNDQSRQVSWLAGYRLAPPSPNMSGIMARGYPLTVAGAAIDLDV